MFKSNLECLMSFGAHLLGALYPFLRPCTDRWRPGDNDAQWRLIIPGTREISRGARTRTVFPSLATLAFRVLSIPFFAHLLTVSYESPNRLATSDRRCCVITSPCLWGVGEFASQVYPHTQDRSTVFVASFRVVVAALSSRGSDSPSLHLAHDSDLTDTI